MGWTLCDGTAGTPDLRDRFIYGTGAGENPGETGGTAGGHTHLVDIPVVTTGPPSFTYPFAGVFSFTQADGSHTHSYDFPDATSSTTTPTNPLPPYYRLAFIMNTATIPSAVGDPLPIDLTLRNDPNPFDRTTMIHFGLGRSAEVVLGVYDVSGRLVKRLLSGPRPAGEHTVSWDGTDESGRHVGAGVYAYRLSVAGHGLTRRMVLVR